MWWHCGGGSQRGGSALLLLLDGGGLAHVGFVAAPSGGGVHVVAVRGRQYVGWQCVFTGSKLVDNLLTGSVLTGSVLTGSVVTGSGLLLLLSGGSHCLAVLYDCCCWSVCRVVPPWRLHAVTCRCQVAASVCA